MNPSITASTLEPRPTVLRALMSSWYNFDDLKALIVEDSPHMRELLKLPRDKALVAGFAVHFVNGLVFNLRRPVFQDVRVRQALGLLLDFEWTNKTIMYGSYDRTHSVFQNSPLMAQGKPSPEELALLEKFRGKVADEVFGESYLPPVTDGHVASMPLKSTCACAPTTPVTASAPPLYGM